jgi:hypothetical protein
MPSIQQQGIQSWWVFSITLSLVGLFMALMLGSHPAFGEPRWGSLASGIAVFQAFNVCFVIVNGAKGARNRWKLAGRRHFTRFLTVSLAILALALAVLSLEVWRLNLVQ